MADKAKKVVEEHHAELEAERQKWKKRLEDQGEEYKENLQMLKTEYTITVDRLREVHTEAIHARENANSTTK